MIDFYLNYMASWRSFINIQVQFILTTNSLFSLMAFQDHIVKLNKENGSLKQNLEATNAALRVSRIEGSGASTNGTYTVKVFPYSN